MQRYLYMGMVLVYAVFVCLKWWREDFIHISQLCLCKVAKRKLVSHCWYRKEVWNALMLKVCGTPPPPKKNALFICKCACYVNDRESWCSDYSIWLGLGRLVFKSWFWPWNPLVSQDLSAWSNSLGDSSGDQMGRQRTQFATLSFLEEWHVET